MEVLEIYGMVNNTNNNDGQDVSSPQNTSISKTKQNNSTTKVVANTPSTTDSKNSHSNILWELIVTKLQRRATTIWLRMARVVMMTAVLMGRIFLLRR